MNRVAQDPTTSSGTLSSALAKDPRQVMDDMQDGVSDIAGQARKRAMTLAEETKDLVVRHPYATLAVAAGLAFTIGALWKLNAPRSRFDALWDSLPDRAQLISGRWR